MNWFNKSTPAPAPTREEPQITRVQKKSRYVIEQEVIANNFKAPDISHFGGDGRVATMDYSPVNSSYQGMGFGVGVPDNMLAWYGSQSFIGYQACMIMSQHWLIRAACSTPIVDSLRKGWTLERADSKEIDQDTQAIICKFDKSLNLKKTIENFGTFARIFGYRLAIYKVDSSDPDYYENPFNPDGVERDSYQGIALVDPYYAAPILESGFDPASPTFMEPEYWLIQGKRYHKSHCCIFRHKEVATLQKPVYLYGGISLTQEIYEAVYSAISASNEANRLLMTKRLNVRKGDVRTALLDQVAFEEKMQFFERQRDNYGTLLLDTTEEFAQVETALAEVTNVISQKFEIVAAIARIPTNRLMQTPLQGFAASGEAEEAIYGELQEHLQEHCHTPFLEGHYIRAFRSLGLDFEFSILWPPVDTITELEQAQINQAKAQADQTQVMTGALSAEDVRNRLVADKDSGYHGITTTMPAIDYENDNEESDSIGTMDASMEKGDKWITTEEGSHVLLDKDGTVKAGMGGKFNGKNIKDAHGTKEFTKHETNAETEVRHAKNDLDTFNQWNAERKQKLDKELNAINEKSMSGGYEYKEHEPAPTPERQALLNEMAEKNKAFAEKRDKKINEIKAEKPLEETAHQKGVAALKRGDIETAKQFEKEGGAILSAKIGQAEKSSNNLDNHKIQSIIEPSKQQNDGDKKMNKIEQNFKKGIAILSDMASKQPEAQKEMFFKLRPRMEDLAKYYDTLPENNNYELHGHEWALKQNDLNANEKRVVVAFTSQAIRQGRDVTTRQ